jgi:AraC family transcriptional regulator
MWRGAPVERSRGEAKTIEAERAIGLGCSRIVHKSWNGPIDVVGTANTHHLELSLLPSDGPARGCFPNDWGPHRFEPFGEVFLLPASHTVHARSDCRQQISVVCSFEPEAVGRWFDGDLEWTAERLKGSLDVASANVRALLFRIGEELRRPGFASDTMIELLAAQAVVELSRYLMGIEERSADGGLCPWRLRRIEERLMAAGPPPSLSELAVLCGLSVRHLTRAFRVSRGRSIGSYIADHRIKQAKRLLSEGLSVKAVAYSVGFSAPSNFAAAFLRATGETPRHYKERLARAASASVPPPRIH